jgi:DNA replication protein DnaD
MTTLEQNGVKKEESSVMATIPEGENKETLRRLLKGKSSKYRFTIEDDYLILQQVLRNPDKKLEVFERLSKSAMIKTNSNSINQRYRRLINDFGATLNPNPVGNQPKVLYRKWPKGFQDVKNIVTNLQKIKKKEENESLATEIFSFLLDKRGTCLKSVIIEELSKESDERLIEIFSGISSKRGEKFTSKVIKSLLV